MVYIRNLSLGIWNAYLNKLFSFLGKSIFHQSKEIIFVKQENMLCSRYSQLDLLRKKSYYLQDGSSCQVDLFLRFFSSTDKKINWLQGIHS